MTEYPGTSAGPQLPMEKEMLDALLKALKPSAAIYCAKQDEPEARRIAAPYGFDVCISELIGPEIQFILVMDNALTVIKRNGEGYRMRMKSLREQFPIWAS